MRALRAISVACALALLALTAARQLAVDPLPQTSTNTIWLALQLLPLLAVLPGLLRLRQGAYVAAALVAMLYFVHGVQASFGPSSGNLHIWGLAEAILSVVLIGFASYGAKALRVLSLG